MRCCAIISPQRITATSSSYGESTLVVADCADCALYCSQLSNMACASENVFHPWFASMDTLAEIQTKTQRGAARI